MAAGRSVNWLSLFKGMVFPGAASTNDHKVGGLNRQRCGLAQVRGLEVRNPGVSRGRPSGAPGRTLPCLSRFCGCLVVPLPQGFQIHPSELCLCLHAVTSSVSASLLCLQGHWSLG